MISLEVTVNEAWCIRDTVRRTNECGHEWTQDFDVRVLRALVAAKAGNGTATLELEADELWWLHRQVPSSAQAGSELVGRNLLLKVAGAILEAENRPEPSTEDGEPRATAVAQTFERAFRADDEALEEFLRRYPE